MLDKKPSKKLTGMLDYLLNMAKDMLEKFNEFDPMGMVLTEEGKVIFLDTTLWQADGSAKGMSSKQLVRRIEDGIRKIRSKTSLDCAIIFYDATIRAQDGSDEPRDVLTGRLEEKNKGAYQVIIEYEIKNGQFKEKSQSFIQKEYHLIST